jgi:hypothetical protein
MAFEGFSDWKEYRAVGSDKYVYSPNFIVGSKRSRAGFLE